MNTININTVADAAYNTAYERDGYFTVPGFLNEEEIQLLLNQLESKNIQREGFYTSTCIDDKEYREYCNRVIQEVVHPAKIAQFIKGYATFYANFINKTPNSASEVVLHTDWSITDETKYRPFKIWIPLVAVNKQNGTFSLVRGSHKVTNKYRGHGANEYYTAYSKGIIENCLTYLNHEAGHALFYHPGLLHYSPPNTTNVKRPAILISLSPAGTQPILYYKNWYNLFNTMSVYKFVPEFMNTWDKISKPSGLEYVKKVKEQNKQMSESEFIDMFRVNAS